MLTQPMTERQPRLGLRARGYKVLMVSRRQDFKFTQISRLPDQDEYEVRIYDERHGRWLVAAIELISPANKYRPESRRAFVGKVAALLQHNVCVSLVDVVTIRDFNLYVDLLEFIGGNDPGLERKPPCLYAVTMRGRKRPG